MKHETYITADELLAMGSSDVDSSILSYPGMIGRQERNALFHLILNNYRTGTAVIDAGIFLGASTFTICSALRQLGQTGRIVDAFELGNFNRTNARKASHLLGTAFQEGNSFEPISRRLLGKFKDLISFHFADITQSLQVSDRPVSVAFIDIVKNAEIADRVVELFFSRFVSHETIVIQQDYFDPRHPWIQFTMASYPGSFRYLGRPESADFMNTAVFITEDLDFAAMRAQTHRNLTSRDTVLDIFDQAVGYHQDPVEKMCVAGSRAAAQAAFDLDSSRVMSDFCAYITDLGLHDILSDPRQEAHLTRIETAVQAFSCQRRMLTATALASTFS